MSAERRANLEKKSECPALDFKPFDFGSTASSYGEYCLISIVLDFIKTFTAKYDTVDTYATYLPTYLPTVQKLYSSGR